MNNENNIRTGEVTQLRRIADAMDEILRLVKKDMEPKKKKVEGDPQAMNAFGD